MHTDSQAYERFMGRWSPPIVLLHGPGEYAAKWLRIIPDLVRTHRVAPDLPAHGESELFDGPPEVDRVFAWFDDLMECTCPTRPALVGQILGGAIAARFASHHSDRVGSLVLADSLGLKALSASSDLWRGVGGVHVGADRGDARSPLESMRIQPRRPAPTVGRRVGKIAVLPAL